MDEKEGKIIFSITLLAAAVTGFLTVSIIVPYTRRLALKTGFVDRPTKRKIHSDPVPLLGGLAIFLGAAAAMLLFLGLRPQTLAVLTGGLVLVAIGLTDDWFKSKGKEFPVWPRLLGYLAVSAIPPFFGVQIIGMTNLLNEGMWMFAPWFSWLTTMLWIFLMTNMINFIDGVDGLATGIVTISSLTLFFVALLLGREVSALMAVILVGAGIAFLRHNFYPAQIFMGDAGATFLGYMLAVIAIDGAFKTFVSILVPMLAVGVPISDTIYVMLRRFIEKKGLHRADKLHTHHILMNWGLNQIQTVSFLYLIGIVFSLAAIILLLIR